MAEDTTYRASVVAEPDRPVRSALPRGDHRTVILCGRCDNWLVLGYIPEQVPELHRELLECSRCGACNDLGTAERVRGARYPLPGIASALVGAARPDASDLVSSHALEALRRLALQAAASDPETRRFRLC